MKKSIIFAIICTMLVSFIGCNKSSMKVQNGGSIEVSKPGEYPIVKEPVTLNIFVVLPEWVGDMATNKVTKWYEEKTNVKINWQRVSDKEGEQKMALLLASGSELPDAFMTWGMSQEQQIVYGQQGVFLPINDLIKKHGFGIKKMFAHDKTVEKQVTAPDGKIYGLPKYAEQYHVKYPQKAWINEKWLNKLGLKAPTTTDELYNVLLAFKNGDPNGNGINDEIPFSPSRGNFFGNLDGFLMNPFIYNDSPRGDRLILENGKVISAFDKPEWKDGLRFIRKLYSEKLIDPESFVSDQSHIRMLVENEKGSRVGMITAGAVSQFADLTKTTKEQYVALEPLVGPKGLKQTAHFPTVATQACFVITSNCKYPEVAFKWADGMYEDDYEWRGEKDVDWKFADEGAIGLDGKPAKIDVILPYGMPQNSWWAGVGPQFHIPNEKTSQAIDLSVWNLQKVLYDATRDKYEKHGRSEVLPPLFYDADIVSEVAELKRAINDYVNESLARFVTGDLDLDKNWDQYINTLNSLGLQKYIEYIQEAYDKQYK